MSSPRPVAVVLGAVYAAIGLVLLLDVVDRDQVVSHLLPVLLVAVGVAAVLIAVGRARKPKGPASSQ